MAAVITTIFAQEAALKKQQIPDYFFDALYLALKIKEKEAIASINNQLEKTLEEN